MMIYFYLTSQTMISAFTILKNEFSILIMILIFNIILTYLFQNEKTNLD